MVRRFVEQEQVRVLGDGPCEQHATLLPAGKTVEQSVGRDARLAKYCLGVGIVVAVLRNACHHHVAHGAFHVGGDFLHHAGNLQASALHNLAAVHAHRSLDYLEQRALAFAVTAYKANAVARLDIKRGVVQERRAAKT